MGTWFFKPEIIARKPAPILINWLDYPNSSGLPFDYLMVDPYTKPKDELMLEKPLQLPSSWLVLDNRFMQGYDINPNIPQKRNGYITFGTMNSIYKFNLRTIKLWAEIMNAVPNSRFLYVRREDLPSTFKQNFIQCMSDLGVDQSRIAFRSLKNFQNPVNSLTNMPSHVMEYNSIDIAFDTIPRNGGTTTCEALWMGVPVVTLVGEAFYERLSFSSLSNVGLADFCANTFEEYKAICLKLAADIDLRSYLRNNLRAIMHKSPLGDAEQFVKGFIKKIDDVL
jgi:predicted O-linked N-acetylglucosamine transferase (SPINDLY family)